MEMPVLIQYLGTKDEDKLKLLEPKVHGNVKDRENANSFQRTLPSTIENLKKKISRQVCSTSL